MIGCGLSVEDCLTFWPFRIILFAAEWPFVVKPFDFVAKWRANQYLVDKKRQLMHLGPSITWRMNMLVSVENNIYIRKSIDMLGKTIGCGLPVEHRLTLRQWRMTLCGQLTLWRTFVAWWQTPLKACFNKDLFSSQHVDFQSNFRSFIRLRRLGGTRFGENHQVDAEWWGSRSV
jgi:hypothetical protein